MAEINLLPWREALRKKKQKDFAVQAVLVMALAAVLVFLAHMQIQARIDAQEGRNAFLQKQIRKVNQEIREIRDLESTREKLLARMNVIQELQQNRPLSVHLMDQLVRTLPDGVYLDSFTQKGNELTMKGVAESNARVSAYMRNIDASPWMADPRLEVIENRKLGRNRVAVFTLKAKLVNPRTAGEDSQGTEKAP
ncbi:MAG: pilus assembly protein PilN [Gammaproteobacteria bacterium]|nr:MAG: pilus assembly protein PilN [Gammaproteobacteria bacterium]